LCGSPPVVRYPVFRDVAEHAGLCFRHNGALIEAVMAAEMRVERVVAETVVAERVLDERVLPERVVVKKAVSEEAVSQKVVGEETRW
jgi:hypothetical protein